jgi:hypothetical protein
MKTDVLGKMTPMKIVGLSIAGMALLGTGGWLSRNIVKSTWKTISTGAVAGLMLSMVGKKAKKK